MSEVCRFNVPISSRWSTIPDHDGQVFVGFLSDTARQKELRNVRSGRNGPPNRYDGTYVHTYRATRGPSSGSTDRLACGGRPVDPLPGRMATRAFLQELLQNAGTYVPTGSPDRPNAAPLPLTADRSGS